MISALLVEVSKSGGGAERLQHPRSHRLDVVCAAGERKVDPIEYGCSTLIVGTDDDAIGMQEIDDRGSFPKKLRIRNDVEEIAVDTIALHGATDPFVGIDGYRTFLDDRLYRR